MEFIIKTEIPEKEKVWKLFLTTGWNDEYNLTEKEYYNAVINSSFIAGAYHDDELLGYGRVVCDGMIHAMIYDLIVLPEYQGNGIGGDILTALMKLCREAKIRDIQLFSAKGKKEFYEKRGFVPREIGAPGMDYKG